MTGSKVGARFVLVLAAVGACSDRPSVPDATLVITNVTVIDGTDGEPLPDAAITIRGNRIAWVGARKELSAAEGVAAHDAGGAYVIPGLWDMHTHVLWEPFVSEGFLRLFLVNGVTGIRDMGGTLDVLSAVRPGAEFDSPMNPRVVAAGPWLNGFVIDPRAGIAVMSADEARAAVGALDDAGVDFIKTYVQLPPEAFYAAVDEAGRRGLPVSGHVPIGVSSREASDLGMRSIEHMRSETGGFCEEAGGRAGCEYLFDAFRRNGTWHTPTLLIRSNRALLDQPSSIEDSTRRYTPAYLLEEWATTLADRLGRESLDELGRRYAAERDLAAHIHDAALPILAGSDAGDLFSLAGFSLHDELRLLVDAGLSPREAIYAATRGPAEFLGATDSLGTIAPGRVADLVLLYGNPLDDIRNTTTILAVVRDGRLYDRAALDDILSRVAEAAASPP
ncbi:MAG: amidohydrolase family protein [Gemmatimonadota bacterium]|nr:amidohydrolase family protein [Gemmatimonadota bacterium]